MKKDELFDYLVNRLLKNKTFFNMDKTIVEDEVEKLIREQGSYERNLFELYTQYDLESEDNKRIEIGNKILTEVPNDYDIKSDLIFYSTLGTITKIQKLENLEKECYEKLNNEEKIKEDLYLFVEGREYLRMLDKLACLYLDINKKKEYINICEKILSFNPLDSLSMLDTLSLVLFNNGEYNKIQSYYKKHQNNLILKSLDFVIKTLDNKDTKFEIIDLLKRNHFLVYYFANLLEIKKGTISKIADCDYFSYGSLEEMLLTLLDIEETLDQESLERYAKSFYLYKGDEIEKFISNNEKQIMLVIIDQFVDDDPTKEELFTSIKSQQYELLPIEHTEISINELDRILEEMTQKYLITIKDNKIRLTLGGLMHIHTLINRFKGENAYCFEDDSKPLIN